MAEYHQNDTKGVRTVHNRKTNKPLKPGFVENFLQAL
ncbi:hypothetical protein COLO4_22672 [Corchorus olitorius]|uniref:Uncharacterized protein n=1 Tax=Corchorus olitorius TaxID=93759 RepID=A0A1R3IKR1_9ROSI|nr:hypothetical protein COLO4_22672 [Corchorus olitorius]